MKGKDILSVSGAVGIFVVLLLGLKWNPLSSGVIAAAVYFGLTCLLTPRRKIGGVDVETLPNGEQLEETFAEAQKDLETIEKAGKQISRIEISRGAQELVKTGGSIIRYLSRHVDKISQARRFLNYYLDTAADILTRYLEFKNSGAPESDMRHVTENTAQAMKTLNDAFQNQYSRLLQGEVMEMDVDVDVLKGMAESDRNDSPFHISAKHGAGQDGGAQSREDADRNSKKASDDERTAGRPVPLSFEEAAAGVKKEEK